MGNNINIRVGSTVFFNCYYDFKSKDIDTLIIEDEPKLYKNCAYMHIKNECLIFWKKLSKESFISITLERNNPIEFGKFLVPEFIKLIDLSINDLKQLQPLVNLLDDDHLYQKVIYESYIENNDFYLTDEQRLKSYNEYKKYR